MATKEASGEQRAVAHQTRNPSNRFVKDPERYYTVVEIDGGSRVPGYVSPIMDIEGKVSPLNLDEALYDNHGFVPGICTSRNQVLVSCTRREHEMIRHDEEMQSNARVMSKAQLQRLGGEKWMTPVEVSTGGPRSIYGAAAESVQREKDPEAGY